LPSVGVASQEQTQSVTTSWVLLNMAPYASGMVGRDAQSALIAVKPPKVRSHRASRAYQALDAAGVSGIADCMGGRSAVTDDGHVAQNNLVLIGQCT